MAEAIIASRLFDGFSTFGPRAILIEAGRILDILQPDAVPINVTVTELPNGLLSSGLIDLQVNGGGGVLFNNDPTVSALQTMAEAHGYAGVSRIVPTLISDSPEVTKRAIEAVKGAQKRKISGLLGIHIEGPFLNTERNGAHQQTHLRSIQEEDWRWIEHSKISPTIITLAPEKVSVSDINRLTKLGIKVNAGHTNANYAEAQAAVAAGVSGFTHLFNAMSPLTTREPGAAGAGLMLDEAWVWVIADGHHVHPQLLQLTRRAKPEGKLMLVSDAMATVGVDATQQPIAFELYGETITQEGQRLINSQGRLAGSAISLADAIYYAVNTLDWPLTEVIAMASRYPAEYLGVQQDFGRLQQGVVADLTWFEDDGRIRGMWRAGQRVI